MSDPYAAYPSAPPPSGGWQQPEAVRGPRPSTVNAAFGLMMANCVISVVSLIITFGNKDEIKRKILDKTPNASQSTLDAAVNVGIVIGIVTLVLYAALAFVVRAGRNWGRIVTWVFAGLGVLGFLLTLAQPTIAASRVTSVVAGLIDIALIIVLALRPSNEFFRPRAKRAY